MKRKLLGNIFTATTIMWMVLMLNTNSAFAHGYVETPPARGYQGQLDKESVGWTAALNMYGNVITNPQSLEAPKGFPQGGPSDGRIASANGGFGQIGDYVLDNQTSDRWKKTDINTGANTFTWHYTAPHKTTKWHYYMTKPGWNQNAPLNRDELELIGTIEHDGSSASNNLSHTINIPQNRVGYNVILAVWDVADTSNAFYNVIDVNVKNSEIPVLPTKPTNVKVTNVTKSTASLSWDAQTTAEKYNVYRDGVKIATVKENLFEDSKLNASTEYKYEVQAIGQSGKLSEKSDQIVAKTLSKDAQEKPTAPSGLHSMGETESTISLMWNKATHSSGIKEYLVYRDNILVGKTSNTHYKDKDLGVSTKYKYTVKAISNDGIDSGMSNEFTVSTKASVGPSPGEYREFKIGSFTKPELYNKDEIVSYKGGNYVTLVTHNNYGDSSWNPAEAHSLFRLK
ncbi:carbohydrate-binding protein [Enterococcus faecalis]|uniref:lytic polysaccharide monooxygenase n=1 Tax=Enterococcus faecalis TaxID=1351 RepID=UPI0009C0FF08|nr:lytic polysaccharide monooxygenase [Enterococcus faecalis]EKZ0165455.1 lytic polysaccharide monooxygenase [Enterococcus faecalis]ELT8948092.1 lytic polysaccharide monooxygenase [Enterococcus faecalis]MRJ30695.1 carbohydrate-binding protein [Enterococcus faecalis]OQO71982.1 carbohydrate-binding protein [Enterococcus faecalis]